MQHCLLFMRILKMSCNVAIKLFCKILVQKYYVVGISCIQNEGEEGQQEICSRVKHQESFWSNTVIISSSPVKGTAPSPIRDPPQEPSSHHHHQLHRSRPTIPSSVTIATINHKQQLKIKVGQLTQISLFRKIYCAS